MCVQSSHGDVPHLLLLTIAAICRQAPAPSSSGLLAPLCAAGVDIAVLVLAHLELRDLAALARCSRSLHSLVTDLPESLWREAAKQAFLPGHPVLRAESVRAFMHTQHCAHTALDIGGAVEVLRCEALCAVSPDFKLTAAVLLRGVFQWELSIAELTTGRELHCWTLPASVDKQWYNCFSPANWDPDSCVVALGVRSGDLQTDHLCGPSLLSLVFLHIVTGRLVTADLQHCSERMAAQMHTWSVGGLLLVSWDAEGQDSRFCAYDSLGSRVAGCQVSEVDVRFAPTWSPCGDAVAIGCDDGSWWVWRLPDSVQQVVPGISVQAMAWATSGSALLLFSHSSGHLRAHLWDAGTAALSQELAEVSGRRCAVSWVQQSIVFLCDSAIGGFWRMLVYEHINGRLSLLYALTARHGSVFFCQLTTQSMLCSPDGSHCLFVVECNNEYKGYQLLVLNLRTMAQHSLQLLRSEPQGLSWAPDSSAVHVEFGVCEGTLLLTFL